MTGGEVAKLIDHTLLRPEAARQDIEALCRDAVEFGFLNVCVNPTWVSLAARLVAGSGVGVCAVVGFPFGATPTDVIIETALLTDDEKATASTLAKTAGADFVKTSTGFAAGGATAADVRLVRGVVGPTMGIKAAGGIRDFATVKIMVAAGATRIGTTAGVNIMRQAIAASLEDRGTP